LKKVSTAKVAGKTNGKVQQRHSALTFHKTYLKTIEQLFHLLININK